MNRLLIDGLDGVNNLLAILIVFAGAATGWINGQYSGASGVYAALGGVAGLIVACVVCGLLATLLQIEKHLRRIASQPPGDRGSSAQ